MDRDLRAATRRTDFTESDCPYLILDTGLTIVAANDAFVRLGTRHREQMVGRHLFEVFPDNPDDPHANGVANLESSLEYVLARGRAHDMVVQRYDVTLTDSGRSFVERIWTPVNTPILGDRDRMVGAVHHVEDVTQLVHMAHSYSRPVVTEAVRAQLRHLVSRAVRSRDAERHALAESQRLGAALAALVSARHGAELSPISARRKQLWERIMRHGQPSTWVGWADAVCKVALQELPHALGCAVTVGASAALHRLVAVGGEVAERLDELDYMLGEGPVSTALRDGLVVMVDDLRTEATRWPVYCQAAADGTGVTGVAVIPIKNGPGAVGALALYFGGNRRLTGRALVDAILLGDLAATVIVANLDELRVLADAGVDRAAVDRIPIAVGITCAHLEVSPDEALARIRAKAFATGRSVVALADDIVDRRLRLY